jgi:hypothetical protein
VVRGEAGKEALGTRVRFALELAEDRVGAVRYRAYGCPHTLAACEWLARQLEGRVFTVGAFAVGTFAGGALEALGISTPLEWIERLGLPQAKLGRLLVIEDALRAALAQP